VAGTLVLLRHGVSESNERNLFTGWIDVPLADSGRHQAARAGRLLAEFALLPDTAHTSVLTRAIQTAEATLLAAGRQWIDVRRSWRLNERHYGALQGRGKRDVVAEFGADQFAVWRRSFDGTPPPLADDSPYSPIGDPRYAELGPDIPRTESLRQVLDRLLPYWQHSIRPELAAGAIVLVTSHSNALRALIKHLDGIADEDINRLNVPTGSPLVYTFDEHLRTAGPGAYLDPEAAAAGAAKVADEGGTGSPAALRR
jgi:2,3-bisphosphoglycerate-dependent phosphoglycerate mutase